MRTYAFAVRQTPRKRIDVVANDAAPAPSSDIHLFAGREPWYGVRVGDRRVVMAHADRTLFLVWPTFDEAWPAEAAELYYRRGGTRDLRGPASWGLTGDARFHALFGMLRHCFSCGYGLLDSPCIGGTESSRSVPTGLRPCGLEPGPTAPLGRRKGSRG